MPKFLLSLLLVFTCWLLQIIPVSAAAPLNIAPTNNTTLLVDQRFDLRVETTMPSTSVKLRSLKLNDRDITTEFLQQTDKLLAMPGGELEAGLPAKDSNLYGRTWRNYAFKQPGIYRAIATFEIDGNPVSVTNIYRVQNFQPKEGVNKIVLMIGDGMGNPLRTGARIMEYGVADGQPKGRMNMEKMTELGLVSTHSLDSIIPDSANTAAAFTSGAKTINGALNAFPDNTPSNPLDNPRIETLPQYLRRKLGWGIGYATTAFGTDATPASIGANIVSRRQYDVIAQQFLDYYEDGTALPSKGFTSLAELTQPLDVMLSPGGRHFIPKNRTEEFRDSISRKDGKDLIAIAESKGYSFVRDVDSLKSAPNNKPILGLFLGDFRANSALGAANIPSVLDLLIARGKATINGKSAAAMNPPVPSEFAKIPTLPEMTEKAIAILNARSPKGWFLLVESSQSDKLSHSLDPDRALFEVLTLDKAVEQVRQFAKTDGKTLVIVTSDHAQGQTVGGTVDTLAIRENRIDLRDAMRAFEDAGFPTYKDSDRNGYPDEANPNIKIALGISARPAFRTDFLTDDLNLSPSVKDDGSMPNPKREPNGLLLTADLARSEVSTSHTADDVVLNAEGNGSGLFRGYMDNIEVFQRMAAAISGVRDRSELPSLYQTQPIPKSERLMKSK
jgi:alkaline phosphatase